LIHGFNLDRTVLRSTSPIVPGQAIFSCFQLDALVVHSLGCGLRLLPLCRESHPIYSKLLSSIICLPTDWFTKEAAAVIKTHGCWPQDCERMAATHRHSNHGNLAQHQLLTEFSNHRGDVLMARNVSSLKWPNTCWPVCIKSAISTSDTQPSLRSVRRGGHWHSFSNRWAKSRVR
jgi:hypothetical protein